MAALIIPSKIETIAFFTLNPKSAAIMDPVHAPVPGIGIATNKKSPNFLYLSMSLLLLSAFSSNLYINLENLVLFRNSNTFFTKSNIKGTGMILPKMHIIIAIFQFTPNKLAAIIPPLSSKIGIIDIIKIINSGVTLLYKKSTMPFNKCSKLLPPFNDYNIILLYSNKIYSKILFIVKSNFYYLLFFIKVLTIIQNLYIYVNMFAYVYIF